MEGSILGTWDRRCVNSYEVLCFSSLDEICSLKSYTECDFIYSSQSLAGVSGEGLWIVHEVSEGKSSKKLGQASNSCFPLAPNYILPKPNERIG
jgi:hypothetical protein